MAKMKGTDWLRFKLNISRPHGREDEVDDCTYLSIQRENALKYAQRELADFNEVKQNLKDIAACSNVSDRELNDRLRILVDISRDLIGGKIRLDGLYDTGAMFILQMFYDSIYGNKNLGTTVDHSEHLTTVFDPANFNSDLLNQAYEQSKFLLKMLEECPEFSYLFTSQAVISSGSNKGVVDLEPIREDEWGPNFSAEPFNLDVLSAPLDDEVAFVHWESIMEPKQRELEIDFSYTHKPTSASEEEETLTRVHGKDVSWLFRRLQMALAVSDLGMECTELLETLQTMLTSDLKQDQEIEEDLLGLLGESNLLLTREIIASRKELVNSFKCLYDELPVVNNDSNLGSKYMPYSMLPEKKFRPGQSIVVQTEEERHLQKLVRKIEKKAMKEINREQKDSNGKVNLPELERMRQERELALLNAMSQPLFKGNAAPKQERYPFVFDTFEDAKHSAAFVGGHKMVLPVGTTKKEDKKWEELNIPASSKPDENIVERFRLIQISELDAPGQTAFAGMKQLNQIQSIVFETAYNSNENMLVCAPTGAGKTNIALLTVMKVVRDNLTANGQVRKDMFKIIYVAPMKALASEMTDNFSRKLKPFGINVRELTGDMQLTRTEIMNTQMIVTTPEKWDVVTRKSKSDANAQLVQLVKLIIIDEVHLLQSDRGPVLEALVARTIRQVEELQRMIRLVGLSATLPNYIDVALFLGVTLQKGMFVFDTRFRPVPLELSFVGIKATQSQMQRMDMDEVCYDKVKKMVAEGHQVMVFVHSRNATYKLAQYLRDEAGKQGDIRLFEVDSPEVTRAVDRARNKMLKELLPVGFVIHHAGILRQDRNLVEKIFRDGLAKVLVCTSTLAWGVNLPAHAVIIRGTELYDSAHGEFVDLSMLDTMQIFGRAGRPQYDTEGYACIITSHDKLQFYLSMLTNQYPIESNFIKYMADNLNAEIVSGTVSTIDDAVEWMNYTYLLIRMQRNPLAYGLTYEQLKGDPHLFNRRRELAIFSAERLHRARMIRFDEDSGSLDATDLGSTASFYYIKYDTIERFNEVIREDMEDDQILNMVCQAQEFDQLKSREEEMNELMDLKKRACFLKVPGGVDTKIGKVNILLQAYLSNWRLESFSLISDSMFLVQNIVRMARGLFEYVLKSKWSHMAHKTLTMSKMFEQQMWAHASPLRQFYSSLKELDFDTLQILDRNSRLVPERLRSEAFTALDIGHMVRNQSKGIVIKKFAHMLPWLKIKTNIQSQTKTFNKHVDGQTKPFTSRVVKVTLDITADFTWHDQHHNKSQSFWIWLQDFESTRMYHYERITLRKEQVVNREVVKVTFSIPMLDATRVPSNYVLHVDSDRWLGCDIDEDVTCGDHVEINGN